MTDYEPNLREAVKRFWSIRGRQSTEQGTKTGIKDHGNRSAVTGGAQMDGFVDLVASFICTNGIAQSDVFRNKGVELPGFFRPEKKWDIVFVTSGKLVAAIEFKSHIGPSFGNNFNNRTEEAVGSATDYRTAYRRVHLVLLQIRGWGI